MNRIDQLFTRKPQGVLSIYFTAGYPDINDTISIIRGLEEAGADLLEVGFPFSDPVADGPIIQKSSHQALKNGMNLDLLFNQLTSIRSESSIPKILMGYFNNVYQFGVERFVTKCCESGVDGVIIPDLPPEIFEAEYQPIFATSNIHFIGLISPQTSSERAEYITGLSDGFVYLLSSSSTTGQHLTQLSGISHTGSLPALIGFGIHDKDSFVKACDQANGAIIGSEFIRRLKDSGLTDPMKSPKEETERMSLINKTCVDFIKDIIG